MYVATYIIESFKELGLIDLCPSELFFNRTYPDSLRSIYWDFGAERAIRYALFLLLKLATYYSLVGIDRSKLALNSIRLIDLAD